MSIDGLLWRNEIGCAHHVASASQARIGRIIAVMLSNRLGGQCRQPKIKDLHRAVIGQHQIVRFDVSMNHALLVGMLKPRSNLSSIVTRLSNIQRPVAFDQLR